jgi:hypothetical protein
MAGFSMPIAPGGSFFVHYSDLDQPGIAEAFNALVEERIIAILETGINPVFH